MEGEEGGVAAIRNNTKDIEKQGCNVSTSQIKPDKKIKPFMCLIFVARQKKK